MLEGIYLEQIQKKKKIKPIEYLKGKIKIMQTMIKMILAIIFFIIVKIIIKNLLITK